MNDAFKEMLSDINDFLKTADKSIGTVSERVYRSMSEAAKKAAKEVSIFHTSIRDSIQLMALEFQFAGDKASEGFAKVRAAFDLLLEKSKSTSIEMVSHLDKLGLSANSLPNMILPNFKEILKGQADYNAKLQIQVNEAGRIRQQEVDAARARAEEHKKIQEKHGYCVFIAERVLKLQRAVEAHKQRMKLTVGSKHLVSYYLKANKQYLRDSEQAQKAICSPVQCNGGARSSRLQATTANDGNRSSTVAFRFSAEDTWTR